MQFPPDTQRTNRQIGGKTGAKNADGTDEVRSVPQPYAAGERVLTEGEANALNQTVAENLSNNLRAKLIEGRPEVKDGDTVTEAARPWTAEEAQGLADAYLADYEIGVRRAGSGEPRVTDPVEREARKIAREKALQIIASQGGKAKDFDVPLLAGKVFDANRDVLMKEGARIVKAMEAARKAASGDALDLAGIELTAKSTTPAAA
jgi:hypothetical protein